MSHLAGSMNGPPAREGKRESYAHPVSSTNIGWNSNPITPATPSTAAYPRSGERSRAPQRPPYHAPMAIPPRKMTSTRIWA